MSRRLALLALLVLQVPMTANAQAPGPVPVAQRPDTARARAGAPLPVPGRSMVGSRGGVVAASHPLAAQAGVQVLQRGGNAVDAIIAANAALGVMEPTGNGVGGDLFALVWDPKTRRVHGLNASGWAPKALDVAYLKGKGHDSLPARGAFTVTVPGTVGGWVALRERFGTLPMSTLVAQAVHYAEQGFPVSEQTATLWARSTTMLAATPESKATFLIDGRPPRPGQLFRNPDLARTLRAIGAKGRAAVYEGPVAQAIVASLAAGGSPMTMADLAEWKPEWVEPVTTTYRGWTVAEIPPNSQGIAALMMLNVMERFPIGEWGFHSPDAMHAMIEAKKLAYADLIRYVGDPRFMTVKPADMLDKARAQRRAALVDMTKASCRSLPDEYTAVARTKGSETIYMTAVDKDGMVVSLIQSNYSGFGSGIVPKGAGFMLQNRGALFTTEAGQANTLAGHKRPLHTIIPGMMWKDSLHVGFGIMGGWNQAQAHAQFVSNVVDHGMSLQQALEAGRFTKATFDGCDVEIEDAVPEATRQALVARGHVLTVRGRRTASFGFGQAVMTRDGVQFGASDPRHDGAAIPQPAPMP